MTIPEIDIRKIQKDIYWGRCQIDGTSVDLGTGDRQQLMIFKEEMESILHDIKRLLDS